MKFLVKLKKKKKVLHIFARLGFHGNLRGALECLENVYFYINTSHRKQRREGAGGGGGRIPASPFKTAERGLIEKSRQHLSENRKQILEAAAGKSNYHEHPSFSPPTCAPWPWPWPWSHPQSSSAGPRGPAWGAPGKCEGVAQWVSLWVCRPAHAADALGRGGQQPSRAGAPRGPRNQARDGLSGSGIGVGLHWGLACCPESWSVDAGSFPGRNGTSFTWENPGPRQPRLGHEMWFHAGLWALRC